MPEILFQDGALAVCIKPAGAPSEGEGPQAMPALLSAQLGGPFFPVHRLDQPVGGVMVYARTQKAAAALSRAVQTGAFEKEYLAVLPARPDEDAGTLRDLLFYDRKRSKSFPAARMRAGVKEASLSYRVLDGADALCLVQVRLHTGRTHQIRVQFASRRLPLLGDGKYGSRIDCPAALWSARLRFPHPADGRTMEFTAQPPDSFPWNRFRPEQLCPPPFLL